MNRGLLIAGGSAILLLIFMFMTWYTIEGISGGGLEITGEQLDQAVALSGESASASAWTAFSFIDILLFLCIVVAVGIAGAAAAGALPRLPVAPSAIVAIVGVIALVLIVFRLLVTPGGGDLPEGTEVDLGRGIGLFLGLLAAIGMTAGGVMAMNSEGTSFGDQADRLKGSSGTGPGTGGTTA